MMSLPPHGRIFALDWGSRRIGSAISDATQTVATPLATYTRRTGRRLPLRAMLETIERECPVGLVVGVPIGDDGLEGESAIAAREMGRVVADRAGLPLDWIDESFTTVRARAALRESRVRITADRIDQHAAAALLQEWLDHRARASR